MLSQRAPLPSGSVRIELDDPDEDDLVAERVVLVRRAEVVFDGHDDSVDTVWLATGVDSSRWAHAQLLVLLHAKNTWADGARLSVGASSISLSETEPADVFLGPGLGSVDLDETVAAPALLVVDLARPAALIQVALTWKQATELPGPQTAVLSVWLLGRTGQPPLPL